ncbi:MAG: hypothetical protein IPH44_31015 [Myxococcales bacterium]|nr:hypothetical protein [Myxococcales bacterium]
MLDGLWIASAAPAVEAALAGLPAGAVAVIANPRLARALISRGRAVTEVAADAALAPATFAAVVAVGAGDRADWAPTLAAWAGAVVDGGGLVLVDRAAAVELSRRALCAGLTALEQRVAGRWTVTSGVVSRL